MFPLKHSLQQHEHPPHAPARNVQLTPSTNCHWGCGWLAQPATQVIRPAAVAKPRLPHPLGGSRVVKALAWGSPAKVREHDSVTQTCKQRANRIRASVDPAGVHNNTKAS